MRRKVKAIKEIRRKLVRDREASRPLSQFRYQTQRERELILYCNTKERQWNMKHLDDLTYHVVRNRWIDQRIWYTGWDPLPGSEWMHEMPGEDVKGDNVIETKQHDLSTYRLPGQRSLKCNKMPKSVDPYDPIWYFFDHRPRDGVYSRKRGKGRAIPPNATASSQHRYLLRPRNKTSTVAKPAPTYMPKSHKAVAKPAAKRLKRRKGRMLQSEP